MSSYNSTIFVTTALCCGYSYPLTDSRDSKTYQTVQIGSQCWMAENLNYDPGSNSSCYSNNSTNCATYGRLYNWAGAMAGSSSSSSNPSGVQGVCPAGWHLPSDVEWCQMENTVEPNIDAGCNISASYRGSNTGKHLKTNTWGGDNTSGFSALPASFSYSGSFYNIGTAAGFWSAAVDGSLAWSRSLSSSEDGVYRDSGEKAFRFSVRCIKD